MTDEEGRAIELFGDAAEIRVERVARGFVAQERPAVFGGKDQMNVNGGKGLWHERKMATRMLFANPNVTHDANQCAIPIRHAKRNPFSIPTGLRPPAQGWRSAYLG